MYQYNLHFSVSKSVAERNIIEPRRSLSPFRPLVGLAARREDRKRNTKKKTTKTKQKKKQPVWVNDIVPSSAPPERTREVREGRRELRAGKVAVRPATDTGI